MWCRWPSPVKCFSIFHLFALHHSDRPSPCVEVINRHMTWDLFLQMGKIYRWIVPALCFHSFYFLQRSLNVSTMIPVSEMKRINSAVPATPAVITSVIYHFMSFLFFHSSLSICRLFLAHSHPPSLPSASSCLSHFPVYGFHDDFAGALWFVPKHELWQNKTQDKDWIQKRYQYNLPWLPGIEDSAVTLVATMEKSWSVLVLCIADNDSQGLVHIILFVNSGFKC